MRMMRRRGKEVKMKTFSAQLDTGSNRTIETIACSAGFATTVPVNTTHETGTLLSLCEAEPWDMVLVKQTTDLGEGVNPVIVYYIYVATDPQDSLIEIHHCAVETSWTFHPDSGQITKERHMIKPGQWGYFQALEQDWDTSKWIRDMISAAGLEGVVQPFHNNKIDSISSTALNMDRLQELEKRTRNALTGLKGLILSNNRLALMGLVLEGGLKRTAALQATAGIADAIKALNPTIDLADDNYIQFGPRNS